MNGEMEASGGATAVPEIEVATSADIIDRDPKMDTLKVFFKQKLDWIYLSGHFLSGTLRNKWPGPATVEPS